MKHLLGNDKASTHLDSYTTDLRDLISKLDGAQINSRINGTHLTTYKKTIKMDKTTERQ